MTDLESEKRRAARDEEEPPDVRIVLVDRRPMTRACIADCLTSVDATSRITAFSDPEAVMAGSGASTPDAIILNIGASSVSDIDVQQDIELLRRNFQRTPLVILSEREEPEVMHAAIRVGAQGYITTSLEPTVAAAAVRLVLAGGTFIPVLQAMDGAPLLPATRPLASSMEGVVLTPREAQILDQIRLGKSNKRIAYELDITESTLKSHIRQVKHKLRAQTRVELAMRARELL